MQYEPWGEIMSKKQVAVAKIVDPSLVKAKCEAQRAVYDDGAIFCYIPELGFEGTNYVYCRYGLPIPFFKIQVDQKILVEPTIKEDERWFYTGLVDCGDFTPADADQLMIQLISQVIYASTAGVIHLSNKTAAEPFVLGVQLDVFLKNLINIFNNHIHVTTATIKATDVLGVLSPTATPMVDPAGLNSLKIMGE